MSRSHSHVVSIHATIARKSREDGANMTKFFQVALLSMLLFPYAALISLAMALSKHGNLPDLAADTHTHFLSLPRSPHTLEEATYIGGLLVGEVVEWAKGLHPSPTLIHIDMR